MAKYTHYIELRGQEMVLKEKDSDIDSKRSGLKQKEDEHALRMDRDRAELEDRSAKMRCFNSSTDDGITAACLQKPQKASMMQRGSRRRPGSLALDWKSTRLSRSRLQAITGLCSTTQRQQRL